MSLVKQRLPHLLTSKNNFSSLNNIAPPYYTGHHRDLTSVFIHVIEEGLRYIVSINKKKFHFSLKARDMEINY